MTEGEGRRRGVRDLVGFIGVVLSMLFVGLEVRQNTTAVRSATQQAIADQANTLDLLVASDPAMARLMGRLFEEQITFADAADDPELLQLAFFVRAALRRVENIYLQVENGVLDEAAFDRIGYGFYRTPFARSVWVDMKNSFDPSFRAFFDQRIADAVP
ncbi:MAG: hypothetical protein ACC682_00260 [Gemmatimonadota bacterium]